MTIRTVIFAGGPEASFPSKDVFSQIKLKSDYWIGADRGALHLIKRGIAPDLSVGDFDSVSQEEWDTIQRRSREIFVHPEEKDETDLEIALHEAIKAGSESICLIGVTGGRIDHYLMAIQLMELTARSVKEIKLYDVTGEMWIRQPGTYEEERRGYNYVSFLPATEQVEGLTLRGFKYPLTEAVLNRGSSLAISNQQTDATATIRFTKGLLYGMFSGDEEEINED
ncbi:thiamine diphosphokinase [Salisediminibacterium selenitireducens]|uniref:Thiamine diphosphokinase n=1 Tax=Bacillus selenitireducens (strain ATCC 700615 / DSM 15326 / MLS10) TaxID=439292 RepID=D6XTS1_BACIE|nr:thiamine diphosphokinase [Salisediminibacterium selenitireducens]ADH99207.1 thiamine pyrophosphokinase [[Bacillus] selenitireducens MLS10]